jgi:hypothetical protein
MDDPVDMLLISSSQSSCGFRSTAGAFPSPLTKSEIRAGGEGELKKRNYAPKSAVNGIGLSSRSRSVVLETKPVRENRKLQHHRSALCTDGFTASADFQM